MIVTHYNTYQCHRQPIIIPINATAKIIPNATAKAKDNINSGRRRSLRGPLFVFPHTPQQLFLLHQEIHYPLHSRPLYPKVPADRVDLHDPLLQGLPHEVVLDDQELFRAHPELFANLVFLGRREGRPLLFSVDA
jgi:hypothetical protein